MYNFVILSGKWTVSKLKWTLGTFTTFRSICHALLYDPFWYGLGRGMVEKIFRKRGKKSGELTRESEEVVLILCSAGNGVGADDFVRGMMKWNHMGFINFFPFRTFEVSDWMRKWKSSNAERAFGFGSAKRALNWCCWEAS